MLPEIMRNGALIADDGAGTRLAIGAYVPRQASAAADAATDVRVDDVAPYMMLGGGVRPGTTIPRARDWTPDTPAAMHAAMLDAVADWHPALRGLVERIDRSTLFAIAWGRLEPTPAWEPSRVTLLGDAIHAMLPTLGQGANMALRDAAALASRLAAAARDEQDVVTAIGDYEADMRAAVYPILELSADHSRFGGGGLRPATR